MIRMPLYKKKMEWRSEEEKEGRLFVKLEKNAFEGKSKN